MAASRARTARSRPWIAALLAAGALLALPFGRSDRAFWPLEYAYALWNLNHPLLWLTLAAALAALLTSLAPLPTARRGTLLTLLGALGTVSGAAWLVASGTPFGFGALLGLAALVTVTGHGLSASGRVHGDAFIASGILFAALFVFLFILYPLFTVLREAVVIDGNPTLVKVHKTLTSPLFLLVENPYTPLSEARMVALASAAGALLAGLWTARRRPGPFRVALAAGVGGVLGLLVGLTIWARGALPTSLLVAGIVAPTSTLIGLAFALLGQRSRSRLIRRALGVVGLLPIITPPFVLAFAMIFLFGRRGLVTHQFLDLSTNAIFGVIGVSLAQILAYSPIAYLVLRGTVESLDPALEEAAHTLGAGRWHLFRTVTWPLLKPGLAAAFLLTVIESLADFGNPIILGGDRGYLATEVFLALTGRYDPHEAAVYGTVLLFLVLTLFFIQRAWLGQTSFITVTGRPTSGRFTPLPPLLEGALQAVFLAWAALVFALYGAVIFGSFVKLWGVDNTFTLQHYQAFVQVGLPVVLYTARVAAISAVLATLVGFIIAYLISRQRFVGRSLVEFGSMLSFATPGTVMGVAYILAFNTGPWLLTATQTILVLALVFRNMPVAIRSTIAGLAQIDPSLDEASTTLRASSSTTLRRVLFPLLTAPLLAGVIFAFVRGMTAISQVIFLVSPGNLLATVLLLGWVEYGNLGRAAAMGTVLIVSMLLVILLLLRLTRGIGVREIGGVP